MPGNFRFTARLIVACSAGLALCAARLSALRAWLASSMGYFRFPGRAKLPVFSLFRAAAFNFAMAGFSFPHQFNGDQAAQKQRRLPEREK
jgi:hypothetical protein